MKAIVKAIFNIKPKWLIGILIFAVIANHLADIDHFPWSPTYHFPLQNIVDTFVRCVAIVLIASLNFDWYKKHVFHPPVPISKFGRYLVTSLFYITLVYSIILLSMIFLFGEERLLYNIAKDYGVTMLVSALIVLICFSEQFLLLQNLKNVENQPKNTDKAKTTIISNYTDIAYFYSVRKIVFIVKNDGTRIPTEYALTQLESESTNHGFLRANRQLILHKRAIEGYEKIENGKLLVHLLPLLIKEDQLKNIISRYKRKDFIDWYNSGII